MKKKWILFVGLILVLLIGLSFFMKNKNEIHLIIIPHFMLDTTKVDEFYSLIHDKRYLESDPDSIILISPNHFFQQNKKVGTIGEKSKTWYLSDQINLSPFPNVGCDSDVFGDGEKISEHGLGNHFRRLNKYFSGVEIFPLIFPSYDMLSSKNIVNKTLNTNGNILIIASVDFSHYLSENIALQHDLISIQTIQSGTGNDKDFYSLDVDCPACLFFINEIAKNIGQTAQFRYRDSSSTIMGYDLFEENTSRVFIFYD